MAKGSDWISATEAGRKLQVHPQTVKAWAAEGYLVGHQPHPRAHHLISLASVERMLEARRQALARLEHVAAEATTASDPRSKFDGNSAREGESGVAGGRGAHKQLAAFWLSVAPLTQMPRNRLYDA